ncbi:MAG: tetratricopeptide repeat protein [Candidatus Omnitrophota bacterium]
MRKKILRALLVLCFLFTAQGAYNTYGDVSNKDDATWEMTLEGIEPMYGTSKMGRSQREMDKEVMKLLIEEAGSIKAAVAQNLKGAWNYYRRGFPRIALRKFNQAWSLDNNNAEVYFGFGTILSQEKKTDKAIVMYDKAIKLDPAYFKAYANRGLDYANGGNYENAILDFTKAITLEPKEAQTYNDRAVAYFFTEQYDKCRDDIRQAQQLGYAVHPDFLAELERLSEKH